MSASQDKAGVGSKGPQSCMSQTTPESDSGYCTFMGTNRPVRRGSSCCTTVPEMASLDIAVTLCVVTLPRVDVDGLQHCQLLDTLPIVAESSCGGD